MVAAFTSRFGRGRFGEGRFSEGRFSGDMPPNTTPDVTAPTLSGLTGTQTGTATADWSAISDEAGGTIFAAARLAGAGLLSKAEIEAGSGNAVAVSVDATPGAGGGNGGAFSGLSAATGYRVDAFHRDGAGNESAVISSAPFTTAAAATAPAQFAPGDWSVADDATGGDATVSIAALPGNGGSPITGLFARIDGGAAVPLGGTAPGAYALAGLFTDGVQASVTVHAANAVGSGPDSAAKTVTTSAPGDITAPVISAASATPTGGTGLDWSVTTDEAGGVLFLAFRLSGDPVLSKSDIENVTGGAVFGGARPSPGVGANTGAIGAGLNSETAYTLDCFHRDGAGNESGVFSSASFVMPDITAPILSVVTGSATGAATAAWTASTNEAGGTIFAAIRLATDPALSAPEIEAGSGNAVASDTDASPTADGANGGTFSGLSASTDYIIEAFHRDMAGNDSAVASALPFATAAAGDTTPPVVTAATWDDVAKTLDLSITEATGSVDVYWALVTGPATPSEAEIIAGSGGGILEGGTYNTIGGIQNITLTNMAGNELHFVVEDAAGNSTGMPAIAANTIVTGITVTGGAAAPAFQALGPAASGTAGATVSWPAHQAGDIGILIAVEQGQRTPRATPAGWTLLAQFKSVTTSAGTLIEVFAKTAADGAEADVALADIGAINSGLIATVRGAASVARLGPDSLSASATTAVTLTGGTTAADNALVLGVVGAIIDSAAEQVTGWANADLTNVTDRGGFNTTQGNGAAIEIFSGEKAAAGAVGNTTATLATADQWVGLLLAFTP